jgi:tetraacyldisaccharide 4'-kinase
MKLATPRWWYLKEARVAPVTRGSADAGVVDLGGGDGAAERPRPGRDPGVPVICVGNLTLGGTGKTPWCARSPGGWARRC